MLAELTLYIAPGCPHCQSMIKICTDLVKAGDIARLEIINIAEALKLAQQAKVRSTPFVKIADFDLVGLHTKQELKDWIAKAHSNEGKMDYINQLFEQGKIDAVEQLIKASVDDRVILLNMLADMDTPFTSRIGISALFEGIEGTDELVALIPQLCDKLPNKHASIRVDIAYILGLTKSRKALDCLQPFIHDEFADVRESVEDAMALINHRLH